MLQRREAQGHKMRYLFGFALAATLVACGGGGDGGTTGTTPPPPPPSSTATVQMNASGVSVSAYAANLAPLPAVLTATIINPPGSQLHYSIRSSGKAVAGSSFAWQSSQTGSVTIDFPSPGSLGAGNYTGSVQLSVCVDSACAEPLIGSPVTLSVAYLVNPGSQPQASFTIQPDGIPSPLFTSQTALKVNYAFYVTDFPSSGLWIDVSQPVGGPIASAAFVDEGGPTFVVGTTLKSPAALGPGIYNSSVYFSLCYDSACKDLVPGSPMVEPLDFTISATAGIEYTSNPIPAPGASYVAWDPANQQLYATTTDGGPTPDALVQLDPATGVVGASLTLPVALSHLAISDDGQYAYVASRDQPLVYRVDLPSLTSDLQIPLGSTQNGANSVYQMAVAPGAPQTLAVSLGDAGSTAYTAGVAVFDGAVQRPDLLGPLNSSGTPAPIAWGNTAATLFAIRTANAVPAWLAEIDSVVVDSNGLSVGTAFSLDLASDGISALVYGSGKLYGNDALVRDAATGATLGQFVIPGGYQIISLLPDPANGRVVFLTHVGTSEHLVLLCYDATTFSMTSLADLGYDNSGGYPLNMALWGTDGIAFDYGGDEVLVLAGAFVKPSGTGGVREPAALPPHDSLEPAGPGTAAPARQRLLFRAAPLRRQRPVTGTVLG